jgi:hypothetical protein
VLVPRSDDRPAHDRLAALERLARLHKQGMLSAEEFAAEKARILNPPVDGRVASDGGPAEPTDAERPPPHRGPSLLGRLLSWRFVPVGVIAGLGLSFASQPQETMRFFDEALRLLGV